MALSKNVGIRDKSIRMIIAMALALSASLIDINPVVQYIMLGVAVILLITGFTRRCPIYLITKSNTCETDK